MDSALQRGGTTTTIENTFHGIWVRLHSTDKATTHSQKRLSRRKKHYPTNLQFSPDEIHPERDVPPLITASKLQYHILGIPSRGG